MKIALIGYGKMGRMIEQIARDRGHEIVSIIDIDNQQDFDSPEFASADVAIEFTAPQAAYGNYLKAWAKGVKVVSGSTGWMKEHGDEMPPERLDRYIRLLHDQAAEALVPGTYAFTSFSVPTLTRFRELYPDARLGFICSELSEANIAKAARLGCIRIAPEWGRSGPLSVAKAHAAGLSVNLWCSDSTFIYDTVKAWGSDVSTSNVPRAILAHARAMSQVD